MRRLAGCHQPRGHHELDRSLCCLWRNGRSRAPGDLVIVRNVIAGSVDDGVDQLTCSTILPISPISLARDPEVHVVAHLKVSGHQLGCGLLNLRTRIRTAYLLALLAGWCSTTVSDEGKNTLSRPSRQRTRYGGEPFSPWTSMISPCRSSSPWRRPLTVSSSPTFACISSTSRLAFVSRIVLLDRSRWSLCGTRRMASPDGRWTLAKTAASEDTQAGRPRDRSVGGARAELSHPISHIGPVPKMTCTSLAVAQNIVRSSGTALIWFMTLTGSRSS
jgi:hypothetical protein